MSIQVRIADRYKVGAKIAVGSFCSLYIGRNVQSDTDCIIKVQSTNNNFYTLQREQDILNNLQGNISIPKLYHFSKNNDYLFLIEDQLGLSLQKYFNICSRKFSLKTVLILADQLLSAFQFIHNKNIIYRDMSSQNILMGLGKKNHIAFVTDFGLSVYSNQKQDNYMVGTFKFISPDVQKDRKHSYKTDLQALGIMLVYFIKGSLPWQRLKQQSLQEKVQAINSIKRKCSLQDLGQQLFPQLGKYFQILSELKLEQKPDYYFLRRLFKQRFVHQNLDYDYVFDWFLIPFKLKNLKPGCNFPMLTYYDSKTARLKNSSLNNHFGNKKMNFSPQRSKLKKQDKNDCIKKKQTLQQKKKVQDKACIIY